MVLRDFPGSGATFPPSCFVSPSSERPWRLGTGFLFQLPRGVTDDQPGPGGKLAWLLGRDTAIGSFPHNGMPFSFFVFLKIEL